MGGQTGEGGTCRSERVLTAPDEIARVAAQETMNMAAPYITFTFQMARMANEMKSYDPHNYMRRRIVESLSSCGLDENGNPI
jgi:ABC-type glutathione transport system ATPase component